MSCDCTPSWNDSETDLLRKILTKVCSGGGGSATSSVVSGSKSIASGATSVSVVFAAAFAAVPIVVATLSRASGDPVIVGAINEASITVNGFTFEMDAATINAGYNLKWMAQ